MSRQKVKTKSKHHQNCTCGYCYAERCARDKRRALDRFRSESQLARTTDFLGVLYGDTQFILDDKNNWYPWWHKCTDNGKIKAKDKLPKLEHRTPIMGYNSYNFIKLFRYRTTYVNRGVLRVISSSTYSTFF